MNTDLPIICAKQNQIELHGAIDFHNIVDLYHTGCKHIALCAKTTVNITLSGLAQSNSACIALLLAWLRYGREQQKAICYYHAPDFLMRMIALSGIDCIVFAEN